MVGSWLVHGLVSVYSRNFLRETDRVSRLWTAHGSRRQPATLSLVEGLF